MHYKYPEMRNELISNLHSLSDFSYQYEAWVKANLPPGKEDCFDYAVHFLYDDTNLSEDPESNIGYFLKDKNEALLIKAVIQSINIIFDKYGKKLSDEEYINKPEWNDVLEKSKIAFDCVNKY